MKFFAERLKELRVSRGLTQTELAKATNLSQSGIALWEAGQRIPNAEAVAILARYFEVSSDYLLGLSDD